MEADHVQVVPRLHQLVVGDGLAPGHRHLGLGLHLGLRLPRHGPDHGARKADFLHLNPDDADSDLGDSALQVVHHLQTDGVSLVQYLGQVLRSEDVPE